MHFSVNALELRVEAGQGDSRGNRFQIPGDTGTELHMPKAQAAYYRIEAEVMAGQKGLWRLVYAPLTINYTSVADQTTVFNGVTFAAGETLKTSFKFNSYRAGYLYQVMDVSGRFKLWLGGLLKVRDAEIKVSGASGESGYPNVGPVPLLSLKAISNLSSKWQLLFQLDGAASSQGRAFDGTLELNYSIADQARVGFGGRFLEGGANNEKVENFAHVNYAYGAARFTF